MAVADIPIANQIGEDQIPAAGLGELIGEPFSTRMRRYAKPQDSSPAMTHDQQAVQERERNRWHHEQVHGGDAIGTIEKKDLPSLRWWHVRSNPRPQLVAIPRNEWSENGPSKFGVDGLIVTIEADLALAAS